MTCLASMFRVDFTILAGLREEFYADSMFCVYAIGTHMDGFEAFDVPCIFRESTSGGGIRSSMFRVGQGPSMD